MRSDSKAASNSEPVDVLELLASIDIEDQYKRVIVPAPAVRPRVLDRERITTQLTTRQKSTARVNAMVLVDSYFTPRLQAGKEYHCLAYGYLGNRFDWTHQQVQRAVEYLRDNHIIQLVIRPSRKTGQPPIYKINSDYLVSEIQWDTIEVGALPCREHCLVFQLTPTDPAC